MRLVGGEWAGWSCAYSTAGELVRLPDSCLPQSTIDYGLVPAGYEQLLSELADDDGESDTALERRTTRLLPADGCAVEDLSAIVSRVSLAQSAATGPDDALAFDSLREDGVWVLETILGGIGATVRERRGALPALARRTRVEVCFDPLRGNLLDELRVSVERQWAGGPPSLKVREEGGKSGLDGAWVSSAIGISCFGEKQVKLVEADDGVVRLPAAGLDIRLSPKLLEIELHDPDANKVVRRNFDAAGESCDVWVSLD